MQYCREYDGSPNVLISVMLAKAARRWDPESKKTVTVSVCIDHKAMLGVHPNYRMFVGEALLDFPKARETEDLAKACTIARGQLMLQVQPENSLWDIKQMKRMLPPPSPDVPQASICISYVNNKSFGPLDPYIEEQYVVTSLSKITDTKKRHDPEHALAPLPVRILFHFFRYPPFRDSAFRIRDARHSQAVPWQQDRFC